VCCDDHCLSAGVKLHTQTSSSVSLHRRKQMSGGYRERLGSNPFSGLIGIFAWIQFVGIISWKGTNTSGSYRERFKTNCIMDRG
jgi:hypothetical protein